MDVEQVAGTDKKETCRNAFKTYATGISSGLWGETGMHVAETRYLSQYSVWEGEGMGNSRNERRRKL